MGHLSNRHYSNKYFLMIWIVEYDTKFGESKVKTNIRNSYTSPSLTNYYKMSKSDIEN